MKIELSFLNSSKRSNISKIAVKKNKTKEQLSHKALLLFSGGLDSTTLLAYLLNENYNVYLLTFNYGQKHKLEVQKAISIAQKYKVVNHTIINLDFSQIQGSALTSNSIEVPKNRDVNNKEIPVTYVPARNTIFLSYALAFAEVNEIFNIYIGVNAVDYSGYPDCREAYIKEFEKLANLATKTGVEGKKKIKIFAPLINLSKIDIIKKGIELKVDYSQTFSCYDPKDNGKECGVCDACQIRKTAFNLIN